MLNLENVMTQGTEEYSEVFVLHTNIARNLSLVPADQIFPVIEAMEAESEERLVD